VLAEEKPDTASAVMVALVIVGALIVGLVSILLVRVCEPVSVTTELGKVGVPPMV
jgi:hypothetical protein